MAIIVKGITSGGGDGAIIVTELNEDGTQSLFISDKDSASDLGLMNAEVDEQTELIDQIQSELESKAELSRAVLQEKEVDPNTSEQVIVPDGDYVGLSKVTVGAVELQEKSVTPSTSSQTITPDTSYDGLSKVTVSAMPTATQATPSISVDSAGLITATATQTAGYVEAGTKSATSQLTVQAAKTVTPSTSNQTAVASGRYTTGAITVKGDANLKAANIVSGVSIFGVIGTASGAPTLLWTNSGPTSNFAAQTVSVTSGYDGYLIEFRNSTSSANQGVLYFDSDNTVFILSVYRTLTDTATFSYRKVTFSGSSLTFETGHQSNGLEGANYCIPTRIWGVKFTL